MKKSLLLACMLLAGCAATGPAYSPAALSNQGSQVVVYRGFDMTTAQVSIGNTSCAMPGKSFVVKPVQPGPVKIIASHGGSGPGYLNLDVRPGETRYVSVLWNRAQDVGGGFGLLGSIAGAAASQGQPSYFVTEGTESGPSGTKEAICG